MLPGTCKLEKLTVNHEKTANKKKQKGIYTTIFITRTIKLHWIAGYKDMFSIVNLNILLNFACSI